MESEAPLPTGAFFEAAFKRFGQRFFGYELWTLAGLLVIPAPSRSAVRPLDLGGPPLYGVLGFGYALGHLALVGTLAVLVTGRARLRAPGRSRTAAVAGALVAGALCAVFPPLVVLVYAPLAFAVIAAAAGDTDGLHALPYGDAARRAEPSAASASDPARPRERRPRRLVRLRDRASRRSAATTRRSRRSRFTTLLVWPLAALVMRNVSGDLTGRVVLRREELAPERVPRRRGAR